MKTQAVFHRQEWFLNRQKKEIINIATPTELITIRNFEHAIRLFNYQRDLQIIYQEPLQQ